MTATINRSDVSIKTLRWYKKPPSVSAFVVSKPVIKDSGFTVIIRRTMELLIYPRAGYREHIGSNKLEAIHNESFCGNNGAGASVDLWLVCRVWSLARIFYSREG